MSILKTSTLAAFIVTASQAIDLDGFMQDSIFDSTDETTTFAQVYTELTDSETKYLEQLYLNDLVAYTTTWV